LGIITTTNFVRAIDEPALIKESKDKYDKHILIQGFNIGEKGIDFDSSNDSYLKDSIEEPPHFG
jgi:hypothetical protein